MRAECAAASRACERAPLGETNDILDGRYVRFGSLADIHGKPVTDALQSCLNPASPEREARPLSARGSRWTVLSGISWAPVTDYCCGERRWWETNLRRASLYSDAQQPGAAEARPPFGNSALISTEPS